MTEQERIEAIVREVVAGMKGGSCKCAGGETPKTSRTAVLTQKERFEIKEYPIPEIGDDDIDAFAQKVWDALDSDNKVSLFVRYIDVETGKADSRIINKNK